MAFERATAWPEVPWDDAKASASGSLLLAENAELLARLRRLGPAMTSMAHDLASARRQNAALRRENLRLRTLIDPRRP